MSLSIWEEAVASISPEWQEQLATLKAISSTPQKLLEIVEKSQQLCQSKQWKCCKPNGQKIYIRDILKKVFTWIEKIEKVGTIISQFDPVHTALPWACIQLLLKIATSDIQKYGAMLESVENVAHTLSRYALIEQIYRVDLMPVTHESIADNATSMRCVIKEVYSSILVFLCKANAYFQQNSIQRFALTALHLTEDSDALTEEIMNNDAIVEKLRPLIEAKRAVHNSELLESIEHDIQDAHEDLQKQLRGILDDLELPISYISLQLQDIKDGLEKQERVKILNWISIECPEKHHKTIARSRLAGSGLWIFKKVEYQRWRRSSQCSLLWFHGDPGVGKSVLVSLAIDHLIAELGESSAVPLAYFYCTRESTERRRSDPTEVLLSILKQLCCKEAKAQHPIQAAVVNKWKERQDDASDQRLDLSECKDLILKLTEESSAFIIIDALDECNISTRVDLLEALDYIIQKSENIVKVLVSSRRHPDILNYFEKMPKVEIAGKDNLEDIANFIDNEIATKINKRQLLDGSPSDSLVTEIKSSLGKRADGNFRWVAASIQSLCGPSMRFGADIRIALRSLPPTLKGVYRIILDQIKMGGPWSGPLATKALRWLLCAQEPLCSSELLKALQSNSENSDDIITKEKLLDVCCNFVKYDGELDVFRFYHLSVREYLDDKDQEDDYGKSISNSSTALACVKSCMENFQPPRPQRKSILSKATTNTFVDYARVYWAFHCELSLDHRRRGELAKALKDFLAFRKGRADWGFIFFLKWWPVSWGNIHHSSATDDDFNLDELYLKLSITCDTLTDPINIACAFGFLEIVQDRCKSGIQNIENYGLSPFEIAVTCGQKEIVRFLVSDSSQQIFVDERVMEFAVIASRKEIAIYLLELDPSITFGKEIIYTAMKYANDDMLAFVLEKNEWTIEVTQKLLHLAVQNKSSSESPIKHIFDLNPMVPICEKIIIAACSNPRHGLKLMESLLPKYNGEFSEEVFECAASNSRLGAAILKLLFSIRPSSPPSIRLIEAAASNFKIESLELLLQRYQSVSISYEAILAAIENEDIGNQALPLLLSRCPASIIDEDLIIAAISNNVHGLELVKLLLKASNLSEVTEEVFEVAAALNWPPYFRVLEELFDHFPKFEVTSTMIVASLKNNDDDPTGTLDLLLKRSHGLEISSDVISASCSNIYYSMELLSYFRKHGYKIEMTKAMIGKIKRNYSALDIVKYLAENGDLHRTTDLLEAAVSNSRSGDKICAFLLSTGDQQITQRAIEQSTQNLFLGAEILSLLLRGNQHIDLSNGSLEIAAEWSFDPNVITILLSSGCTLNFDDCVTAAAAMNDDNSDHLLNIILADHRAPQPTSIVLETALSYRRLTLNAFKILMRAAPRESLTNNAFRNALGLNSRRIPILTDLLDRRPDIGLRDDELDLVLTSVHLDDRELIPQDSPEVLQYLMGQRKSFLISETLLKATVQHGKSLTILKIILSYCDNTAQIPPITEEVLESAFSTNSPDGPHVVVLLLGRMLTNNTFISPSEDLIIAAIRGTTEDSNMLQILIERLGPIALTQRILCETAKNASDCIDVLEVLRNNSPDTFAEVMHGSDFASSYLKNGDCSRQGLRYLKNLAPDRVLTISSELLCLAASNSTEMLRELISIIHEQDQDHLLPSLITEDVIKSICSSHSRSYSVIFNQSLQILRLTLKDHGRALPITTDILRSAMGCPLSGKSRESCILYLKRYIQILKQENRIHLLPSLITEDLIFASVKHHATKKFYKLFKPLLPPFHLDNLLTERLLSAAADNGGSEDDLHFLYDHIIPPPNKPFIHYHEISLFFDAIFTSNIAKIHKYCAKGIPTNTTDFNGLTPLAGAAEMCQIACVRELLKFVNEDPEKGVDLNAICKKGRTPLARAAKKGFSHIAHMLLEAGAKRDIKDLKGRTAEEIALKKRNFMVASMIRDWDAKNKDNHVVPAGQGEKSETAGGDGANEDIRRSLERLGNGEKEGPEKSGILRSQTF